MALASFFNKASLAACQLLRGTSPESLREMLDDMVVAISFSPSTVESQEGRWIIEAVVNLCARLYPCLVLHCEADHDGNFEEQMRSLARSMNPDIEFADIRAARGVIAIGESHCDRTDIPIVYAGSNGWRALVSHKTARSCGASSNPFGAGAAACLATAHLFRTLFSEQIGKIAGEEVSISLLDYSINEDSQDGLPTMCDLGTSTLVGVGAIGNAALWALSKCQLTGKLQLVDPEFVDESNPQRYVLTDHFSPGKSKVEIGMAALASTGVVGETYQLSWADFVNNRLPFQSELVIVALDTAIDRCGVQASLPKTVLNAWTQTGDLGVSRHHFLGDQACLACLYVPTRMSANEDQVIAEALNLAGSPESLLEVRNALYFENLLDDTWLQRISSATQVDITVLEHFKGRPLRALYREGICGGIIVPANGTRRTIEVPMAFQSMMAGLMLASEVVKFRAGREWQNVTTKINLMRPLGRFLSEKHEKRSDRRCFCHDDDYVRAYILKYGETISAAQQVP
jgi:ThiF family